MHAELDESTILQHNMMRIVHLNAFWIPAIGIPAMMTSIFHKRVNMICGQKMNQMWSKMMASRIQNAQRSVIGVPHQMFLDWFAQHICYTRWLKRLWWPSMQCTEGGIRDTRKSRSEWGNMVSPGSLCYLTENVSWPITMGQQWAVADEYWLINRNVTNEIYHSAKDIILIE